MNLNPPLAPLVPLEALAIETPLYLRDRDARILRWNLATGDRQVVLDLGHDDPPDFPADIRMMPNGNVLAISASGERREVPVGDFLKLYRGEDSVGLTLSPDGRWFSHTRLSKDRNAWQFRIFDKATGSHRLYWECERPAQRFEEMRGDPPASPLFSPDGRWIALCCTPEVAMISGHCIVVVDTATLALRAFPAPSSAAAQSPNIFWSPTGSELLIQVLGSGGAKDSEFFALDLSTSEYERIEGQANAPAWKNAIKELAVCFIRGERRIEFKFFDHMFHQCPQDMSDFPERRSPDGRWTALKQKSGELHNLIVLAVDGTLCSVHEQLPYERLPRERVSGVVFTEISIKGWLGRHYLLYYDAGSLNTYVYDAAADRAAVVFAGKQHPASYCW